MTTDQRIARRKLSLLGVPTSLHDRAQAHGRLRDPTSDAGNLLLAD